MPLRVYLQGLTSMDGGELADSIMNFTEEQPSNPKAFRYAKIWLPATVHPWLPATVHPRLPATVHPWLPAASDEPWAAVSGRNQPQLCCPAMLCAPTSSKHAFASGG